MKSTHISKIITDICKEKGIPYTSPNYPDIIQEDAEAVHAMYIQLKLIMARLLEIEERHNIKGLKEIIDLDLKKLDTIDHSLCQIVKKILEEKK